MKRWRSLVVKSVATLKELVETGMRRHITRGGLLFSFTIVIVAFAAFASANNLLFLILAAMLATLMVSGFISRLSLAGLELEFLHPEHISAGRKVAGRIVVHNEKIWIPSFSIQLAGTLSAGMGSVLYFPTIPPKTRLEDTVECYFPRRGRYTENTFCFSTRFPFGFTERRIHVRVQQDILVYPSVDAKPGFEQMLFSLNGDIAAFFRGRGGDFYRIRPYEAFESARHVDWKATAHTGELQVREFAREQEQTILLFLDLEQDEGNTFEAAVDASAYLSWNLAQRGARLRFSTQQFAAQLPEQGDVYTILKYLALVRTARGKLAPPPDDQHGFQVVISVAPDRLADSGWSAMGGGNAFVINPAAFPPGDEPDSASPTAGHRRIETG
jgi:uncharacterized protein (DUF58 family)